jgi:thymidine kinase
VLKGYAMSDPRFIIFTGPMYGSKTTKLLASIDRFTRQKKNVIAFKPKIDNRYSDTFIQSHNGGRFEAYQISDAKDMHEKILSKDIKYDVIAVDEAFMIDNCAEVLIDLFRTGYTIVVSSIQLDANFKPFEEIMKMMPYATQIDICPAVCPATGNDAYYTMAKFDYKGVTVGGDVLYEPRSWSAFHAIKES